MSALLSPESRHSLQGSPCLNAKGGTWGAAERLNNPETIRHLRRGGANDLENRHRHNRLRDQTGSMIVSGIAVLETCASIGRSPRCIGKRRRSVHRNVCPCSSRPRNGSGSRWQSSNHIFRRLAARNTFASNRRRWPRGVSPFLSNSALGPQQS